VRRSAWDIINQETTSGDENNESKNEGRNKVNYPTLNSQNTRVEDGAPGSFRLIASSPQSSTLGRGAASLAYSGRISEPLDVRRDVCGERAVLVDRVAANAAKIVWTHPAAAVAVRGIFVCDDDV
jgi:hypothetical protein